MILVNIAGGAQHGKTTTANFLKKLLEDEGERVLIKNYAGYLKFICKNDFGWNGVKDKEGRTILQKYGTDIVRKKNPDFWVETVARFLEVFEDEFDYVLMDDCRFVNECNFFKDIYKTYNILVVREDFDNGLTEEQKNHPSETSLKDYNFDATLLFRKNDLDHAYQTVKTFFRHIKRMPY